MVQATLFGEARGNLNWWDPQQTELLNVPKYDCQLGGSLSHPNFEFKPSKFGTCAELFESLCSCFTKPKRYQPHSKLDEMMTNFIVTQ